MSDRYAPKGVYDGLVSYPQWDELVRQARRDIEEKNLKERGGKLRFPPFSNADYRRIYGRGRPSRILMDVADALAFLRLNGGVWDRKKAYEFLKTVDQLDAQGNVVSWRGKSQKELAALEDQLKKLGFLDDSKILQQGPVTGTRTSVPGATGPSYRPLAVDTIRDVIEQVAAEEGSSGQFIDKVVEWVAPVLGNREDSAAILWMPGFREKVAKAVSATTEQEALEATEDLLRSLGAHFEAASLRFPRAARIIQKLLPSRGVKRGSEFAAAAAAARTGTGEIRGPRYTEVLKRFAESPEVRRLELEWRTSLNAALDEARKLQQANPHLPDVSENMTLRDLLAYREVAQDKKPFDDLLQVLGVDPAKPADIALRDAYREKALDTYFQARLKELGGEKDPVFSRWLSRIGSSLPIRAWREQALLTPRYHAANALDSVIKGALFGIRPIKASSAFTIAEKLGMSSPPSSVLWRTQGSVWDEFASPEATPALEELLGRVSQGAGQLAGKLVRLNRRISQAMESSFRSAAWASELLRQLKAARPMLDATIRTEIGGQAAEDVIRALDAAEQGVLFSPEKLAQLLRAKGATPDQVAVVQAAWQRAIDEASARGEDLAKKLFFDYGDERNIERWIGIRGWAPFHFWATRNIPFYLETLGQHPWILRAWESYLDASRDWQEQRGLSPRFSQTLPLFRSGFFEFLFGPGTFYANPLVILSVADQLGYRYTPEDAPLLERLQTEASRFGLGLAPWAEIPLGLLGAFGEDWAPPRLLRHSRLLAGLTGIDVEYPLQQISQANRESITGSSYLDSLIKRRILEMSLEETGRAAHPDYVAALNDPESPIWKRAESEVRRRMLGQEILGMTVPTRMPFLGDTEALIRQQRAQLPQNLPPGFMSRAAQEGYAFAAYTPLSWSNTGASRIESLLAQTQNLPLPQGMSILRSDPEGQRYLLWLEQQGILWPWDPRAIAAYRQVSGTGSSR